MWGEVKETALYKACKENDIIRAENLLLRENLNPSIGQKITKNSHERVWDSSAYYCSYHERWKGKFVWRTMTEIQTMSPLYLAVKLKNPMLVKLLSSHPNINKNIGLEVNSCIETTRHTPFQLAKDQDSREIMEILKENNNFTNVKSKL